MFEYFTEVWQGTLEQEIEGIYIPAGPPEGRQEQVHFACEEIIDRLGLADTDKDSLWTEDGSLKIMQWDWPLPNLHLGVSVENQAAADERIPWLLKTPAAVRFLSVEPQLEEIDLWGANYRNPNGGFTGAVTNWAGGVNWIVCGGESGPNSRPFNLDWARSLRDQCQESGTKFFLKQLGSNVWDGDRKLKLRDRKGGSMEEWPEDLRIRKIL